MRRTIEQLIRRPRRSRPRRSTVAAVLLASTLAAAGLAGCTSAGSSTSSGAGSPAKVAAAGSADVAGAPVLAAPAAGSASSGSSDSAGTTTSVALDVAAAERSRILSAQLTLKVTDVGAAVAEATGDANGVGGYVGSADTAAATGPGSGPTANVTLRVPNAQFDAVLTRVSALGKVTGSERSEQDVTGQVADLASRLATQQASIARVRVLFARATSVGEVVALESALTEREATLESLQAQQRALAGQVDDATITLTLLGPGAKVVVVHHPVHHAGFVSGLRGGWHALKQIGRGIAVVAGALLPFAPVFLVVAAVGWWLSRRRPRHDPPTRLPAPAPPTS
jgi:hypothetical protein